MIINKIKSWDEISEFSIKHELNILPKDLEKIKAFYELLKIANEKMNLTRLISLEDFLTFHVADTLSLFILLRKNNININPKGHYLDLGSGAGIPGIIFGIFANLKTTLCDSITKKAVFLKDCIEKLSLEDLIRVENKRAEDLTKKYKDYFSIITARAFAKPIETIQAVKPFLKKNNEAFFLAQTASSLKTDENYIKLLKKMNLHIFDEIEFTLGDKKRCVYLVKTMFSTQTVS